MNVKDYLSKEEIKALSQKSDWKGAWEVLKTWCWITAVFVLVGTFPNIFTIVLGLIVLGGKQLACAIMMHDASHRALFRSPKINDFVGNWLSGYLILNDAHRYRPYHLKHHTHTGTYQDPDLSLTKAYPTTIISFCRKMFRDISGITGVKTQIAIFWMNIGLVKYTGAGVLEKITQKGRQFKDLILTGIDHYWKPITANCILWFFLWLAGSGWLYLLWIGALLTTYNVSLRIRSIAEHSVVPDRTDPYRNTRTTYARWWEKLLFAPHNVNYHAEHHLLMTVPPYNLPKMHKLLKERGFYKEGLLAQNYWEVIKLAVSK
ncbi:MAG: fatty acid desaturase family protein [Microscillaceae bacterium]|nr:fatty acid desaturase family protein [Microscillaceae bacterium]